MWDTRTLCAAKRIKLGGNPSGTGDEFEGAQPGCVVVDIGHDHELVSACFRNERIHAGTNRIVRADDGASEHTHRLGFLGMMLTTALLRRRRLDAAISPTGWSSLLSNNRQAGWIRLRRSSGLALPGLNAGLNAGLDQWRRECRPHRARFRRPDPRKNRTFRHHSPPALFPTISLDHYRVPPYIISMSYTIKNRSKLVGRVRRIRGQIEAIERALEAEFGRADVLMC
jgi:hypothetical protein